MWQDAIFTVGSIALSAALMPAVLGQAKPPRSTCLLSSVILWSYALTFFTMNLVFSAATTGTTALLWTILLAQRR